MPKVSKNSKFQNPVIVLIEQINSYNRKPDLPIKSKEGAAVKTALTLLSYSSYKGINIYDVVLKANMRANSGEIEYVGGFCECIIQGVKEKYDLN